MSKELLILLFILFSTLSLLVLFVFYAFRAVLIAKILGFPLPLYRFKMRVERIVCDDNCSLESFVYVNDGLSTNFLTCWLGRDARKRLKSEVKKHIRPILLIRSPYGHGFTGGAVSIVNRFYARFFAERGFHVVHQNVRGRFNSDGDFNPFITERKDGYAAIKWIREQQWGKGELYTFGFSYGGYTCWAIADHPELSGSVISQSSADLPTTMHRDRAIHLDTALRFLHVLDVFGSPNKLSILSANWAALKENKILNNFIKETPIIDFDKHLLKREDRSFRLSMTICNTNNPLWKDYKHSTIRDRLKAPVLLIGGWHDIFLREIIDDYHALSARKHDVSLLIGSWTHGTPSKDWLNEVVDWLYSDSQLEEDECRYFTMRANEWHTIPSWPPPKNHQKTLFLNSSQDHNALPNKTVFALQEDPQENEEILSYTYDPEHPTPHFAGALIDIKTAGQFNNKRHECRDDILLFDSNPLKQSITLTGQASIELFIASTAESCDFFVRLCDLSPKGNSMNICDGFLRIPSKNLKPSKVQHNAMIDTSQRNSQHPGLAPLTHQKITIPFWPTSYEIPKGHKIRLQVCSGAFPRFNRNLGFKDAQINAHKMIKAKQKIYLGAENPAKIILPII